MVLTTPLPEKEGFTDIIKGETHQLNKLATQLKETERKDKKVYKEIALAYLKALDKYFEFAAFYNEMLFSSYQKLVLEAKEIDSQIKYEYVNLTAKINSADEKNLQDLKQQAILEKRNEAHTKLLESLTARDLQLEDMENPEGAVKILKKRYASKVFNMHKSGKSDAVIIKYIEIRLADMFHKQLVE